MNNNPESLPLLPCPCCTGEAKIYDDDFMNIKDSWYWVVCLKCFLTSSKYAVKEVAIKAWNTRTQTPVPNEHSQEGALETCAYNLIDTIKKNFGWDGMNDDYRDLINKRADDLLNALAATPKPLSVGWISVKDKKPENDDMVLLLGRNGHPFTGWYNHGEIKGFMYIPGKSKHAVLVPMVTHWAILPAPLTTNSEEE